MCPPFRGYAGCAYTSEGQHTAPTSSCISSGSVAGRCRVAPPDFGLPLVLCNHELKYRPVVRANLANKLNHKSMSTCAGIARFLVFLHTHGYAGTFNVNDSDVHSVFMPNKKPRSDVV